MPKSLLHRITIISWQ